MKYYIYKGTSNFCSQLELADDLETMIKARPDGFYDIVQTKDTIEGGIAVVDKSEIVDAISMYEPFDPTSEFNLNHLIEFLLKELGL
jgi:hypothetical protein